MMHLGPWELVGEIGRGGQGIVYRARDASGREMALKTLSEEWSSDPHRVARLRAEADVVGRLRHPGICPVRDVGLDSGLAYLVMDLIEGATLAEELRRVRGEPDDGANGGAHLSADLTRRAPQAVRLVERIARTVHAAHEHGVVHRDLKPANVMLLADGAPVLLDFGLALFDPDGSAGASQTASVRGTPAYMAPEQLQPSLGTPGVRSDVHALGALLYETLLLTPAFDAPTRAGVYREVLTHEVRLPDGVCRSVSTDLAAIIETALAKEPARRYSSALELAHDLARLERGERPRARRAGRARRLVRWAGRQRLVAAASAASLVALCVLGIAAAALAKSSQATRGALQRFIDGETLIELMARLPGDTWPVLPSAVPGMELWIMDARDLLGRRATHARLLATLARRGEPEDGELTALVAGLDALEPLIEEVTARIDAALGLEEQSLARHEATWRATLLELCDPAQSPQYGGLVLRPQLGLVPLGRDPASGLFEFAHVQSGAVPERGPDGRLRIGEHTGLVFVLIPGGSFTMGAERPGPGRPPQSPNVDPSAWRSEAPLQQVELAPFFLSKYEATQAQWLRLTGTNPAYHQRRMGDLEFTLDHPVENVSFEGTREVLRRYGLLLPTEAQWEYAARAGTTSPWSTGQEHASLLGHANLADRSWSYRTGQGKAHSEGLHPASLEWPELDDGWPYTAPVGRFLPNPFGLHDVHGNVLEHVRDAFASYALPARAGDGERIGGNQQVRVARGGSFAYPPSQVRCAYRFDNTPTLYFTSLGCRPARAIQD